jgi:hypothetical protein
MTILEEVNNKYKCDIQAILRIFSIYLITENTDNPYIKLFDGIFNRLSTKVVDAEKGFGYIEGSLAMIGKIFTDESGLLYYYMDGDNVKMVFYYNGQNDFYCDSQNFWNVIKKGGDYYGGFLTPLVALLLDYRLGNNDFGERKIIVTKLSRHIDFDSLHL